MRLKVEEVGPGLHPSEVEVEVKTIHGSEHLVVSRASLKQKTINVGNPVARDEKRNILIELPSETSTGKWRVWIDAASLSNEELEAAE